MPGTGRDTPASALLGRGRECATIDELLAGAAAGDSRVLVIRGEAGIGKTALLDHAEAGAAGWHVLRTAGHEAESSMPFAGLHGLLRPVTGLLGELGDHNRLPWPERSVWPIRRSWPTGSRSRRQRSACWRSRRSSGPSCA